MTSAKPSPSSKIEMIEVVGNLNIGVFLTEHDSLLEKGKLDEADLWLWARCATDLALFAAHYFPHYCEFPFNELHHDLFRVSKYGERSIRRSRAAPRGYAKSTLSTLIKPLHDICYGLEKYVVIFSETQDQANQRLSDIRSEILTNDRLVAAYGLGFLSKRAAETSYIVQCGSHLCLVEGYGAGTEVRGIRFRASRPSKIIVDDGEDSEEVLNEALRSKKEAWMSDVVSKLGDTRTNIEIVGTILHPESLLAKLLKNPAYDGRLYKAVIKWSPREDLWKQWTKLYTNLDDEDRIKNSDAFFKQHERDMLADTEVLWPEKESYLYLMKELIETGKRSFFKEKQNEPIGGDEALFDKFHFYQERSDGIFLEDTQTLIPWSKLKDSEGRWLTAHGVLDPATGQTKAKAGKLGDYSEILTGLALSVPGREHRMRLLVHQDWTKREGPSKWMSEIFNHHEVYEYQKFGVETNLYRDLLLPNLEAERKRQQEKIKKEIHMPFYDIVNVENKEKRIYTLEPKVTHGWILFNRNLSPTFMRQMEAFPHADHDDGPDALEMLWGLVNNRYRAHGLANNPMAGR